MRVNLIETDLPGVVIIEPKKFGDDRGYFMETWNRDAYRDAGLDLTFVQDNLSSSSRGVLRGLHYQLPNGQGKLVSCVQGEVFDVAVDIRRGSPTFGRWVGVMLSADNARRLYVPPAFAHGFQVVSPTALFTYKCTDVYNREAEGSIRWNDPAIGIEWPVAGSTLSDKDQVAPLLADVPPERLPEFGQMDPLVG